MTGDVAGHPIVDSHHHIWRLSDLPWLSGPPVPRIFGDYPRLDTMRVHPRLRGIRQQLHWHTNERYRFASRPDLMNDLGWRRGLAEIGRRGLVFELREAGVRFIGKFDAEMSALLVESKHR